MDDLVELVVGALDKRKRLDNTYIIFMSDNGYHLGQLLSSSGAFCNRGVVLFWAGWVLARKGTLAVVVVKILHTA